MTDNRVKIDSFYFSRCTLFSDNHPILKEAYVTRLYYFTLLKTLIEQEEEYEPYLPAMMKIYSNRWGIKEEDYITICNNKIESKAELLKMLKAIRKNYYSFIGWKLYKRNYKYLFLTHALLLSKDIEIVIKSALFNEMKGHLKIKEKVFNQIVAFVKELEKNGNTEPIDFHKALKELQYFTNSKLDYEWEIKKENRKILVLATVSAGKSTFINSIVGKELLPTKNEACTAKVISITNQQSLPFFIGYKAGDSLEIESLIDSNHLLQWNLSEENANIHIVGPFSPNITLDKKTTLIDTPGTNNSRNKDHAETTFSLMEEDQFHHVFYILNATNLASDDDRDLLVKLLENIPKEDWSKRITFVINKMDEIDEGANESMVGIVETVKLYLKHLGVTRPRLLPFSSYSTILLLKSLQEEKMTRKEQKDFHNLLDLFLFDEIDLSKLSNLKTCQWSIANGRQEIVQGEKIIKKEDIITALQRSGYFTLLTILHDEL